MQWLEYPFFRTSPDQRESSPTAVQEDARWEIEGSISSSWDRSQCKRRAHITKTRTTYVRISKIGRWRTLDCWHTPCSFLPRTIALEFLFSSRETTLMCMLTYLLVNSFFLLSVHVLTLHWIDLSVSTKFDVKRRRVRFCPGRRPHLLELPHERRICAWIKGNYPDLPERATKKTEKS